MDHSALEDAATARVNVVGMLTTYRRRRQLARMEPGDDGALAAAERAPTLRSPRLRARRR